jgi:hypothetical protein
MVRGLRAKFNRMRMEKIEEVIVSLQEYNQNKSNKAEIMERLMK